MGLAIIGRIMATGTTTILISPALDVADATELRGVFRWVGDPALLQMRRRRPLAIIGMRGGAVGGPHSLPVL
jgi:hypothetical protein